MSLGWAGSSSTLARRRCMATSTSPHFEEETELRGRQGELASVLRRDEAGWIELQATHGDGRLLRLGRRTPEHRSDPGHEFGHLEGLGHVVIGPGLQPNDHVDGVGPRGQHQDGHAALLADLAAHLEPVQGGQHDVQDHHVGRLLQSPHQAFAAVHGGAHAKAGLLQAQRGDLSDRRVVLNQEHSFVHSTKGTACPRPDGQEDRSSVCADGLIGSNLGPEVVAAASVIVSSGERSCGSPRPGVDLRPAPRRPRVGYAGSGQPAVGGACGSSSRQC